MIDKVIYFITDEKKAAYSGEVSGMYGAIGGVAKTGAINNGGFDGFEKLGNLINQLVRL